MVKKKLLGTSNNDPEWVSELVSFLITTDDKEKIRKYKKLFRETYLAYVNDGVPTKQAIQKAKSVVLSFSIN